MRLTALHAGRVHYGRLLVAAALSAPPALTSALSALTKEHLPAHRLAAAPSAPGSLANEWAIAIAPAAQRLPQVESALRSLSPSATDAQVDRVVAPVSGLLNPIEGLLAKTAPNVVSLQRLGAPSTDCNGARYENGVKLTMAGQTYASGFQLIDNFDNFDIHCHDVWRWHIGPRFKAFTASIGLDETRTNSASLVFLGPGGKPLAVTADGQTVTGLNLYSGVPTSVTIDLSGVLNFVVASTNSEGGIIDFVNDVLTP